MSEETSNLNTKQIIINIEDDNMTINKSSSLKEEVTINSSQWNLMKIPQYKCPKPEHNLSVIDHICTMSKCNKKLICKICLITDHKELTKFCVPIAAFFDEKSKVTIIKEKNIEEFEEFLKRKEDFLNCLEKSFNHILSEIDVDFEILLSKVLDVFDKAKENIIKVKQTQFMKVKDDFEFHQSLYDQTFFDPNSKIIEVLKLEEYGDFEMGIQALVDAPNYKRSDKIIEYFKKLDQIIKNFEENPYHVRLKIIEGHILENLNNHSDKLLNLDKNIRILHDYSWDAKTLHMVKESKTELGPVLSCCSLNEKFFATGHGFPNNEILVWNEVNMEVVKTLKGHEKSVTALLQLKEDLLLSGSCDFSIKAWELNSYKCVLTIKAHTDYIFSLAKFNNYSFISASHDKTIKLWTYPVNQAQNIFFGHSEPIWFVLVLQDKETIASGSGDGKIKLWEINRGECKKTIKAHLDQVNVLAIFEEDKLISGSDDGFIKMWAWKDGSLIKIILDTKAPVWSLILKSESHDLLFAGDALNLQIINIDEKKVVNTLYGFTGLIKVLYELPSGFIITGSYDTYIRFWNSLKS